MALAARLGETEHVAGRVAERAVPHAVGLVDRLLQNLGARRAELLEGRVAVVGGEDQPGQQALGHQSRDRVPVGRGDVRVLFRDAEDDLDPRLGGRAERDPAEPVERDVVDDLQAE